MPHPTQTRLFLFNTIANFVGRSWLKFLAFLIVPFLRSYLGADHYSLYALALTGMFYATLADPGFKYGYIKVFAEYATTGRRADIRKLLWSSVAIYFFYGMLCVWLAWVFIDPFMRLVGVKGTMMFTPATRGLFMAFLVSLVFSETFCAWHHLLMALQRNSLANSLSMAYAVVNYGGLAAIIWFDGTGVSIETKLIHVSWVVVGSGVAQGLLYLLAMPGALTRIRDEHPARPLKELLGYLYSFGWRVKISANCDTIVCQTDRSFIGHFVADIRSPGNYSVGSSAATVLRDFVKLLVSALLPVATQMAAEGRPAQIRRINRLTSRWFFLLSTPCYVFVIFTSVPLIRAWMGESIPQANMAFSVLSLAFLANTALAASMEIGNACHLPHLQMRATVLSGIVNLLLSGFLVIRIGYIGVAWGSVFAMILGTVYYAVIFLKAIEERFWPFVLDIFPKPLAAGLLAAAPLYGLSHAGVFAWSGGLGRVGEFLFTAALFLPYGALYLLLLALFRHVTLQEIFLLGTRVLSRPAEPEERG
jgi:O-antigen/teichoic acid export membrane protein